MAMVSIDVPKVRGKMAERGYTVTSLSNKLGINRNTLSAYLESPGKMPYSVVSDMAVALCDTADEATAIFLHRTYVSRKILTYRSPRPARKNPRRSGTRRGVEKRIDANPNFKNLKGAT